MGVTTQAAPVGAAATDTAAIFPLVDRLVSEHPPAATPERDLLGAVFDAGLAWVDFPVGDGGLGLPRRLQGPVSERLAAAGVVVPVARNPIGYGMAAPAVVTHGTAEQRRRFLRPLWTGEHVWCQLFSEPSAGSDLASLTTSAERDGDEWVLSGQKVWTTLAHVARYGLLLARSDPTAERHRGLIAFALDMHAPGVEVRPLRQLTGDAEFNEVDLDEVRVPDRDRLGDAGQGWAVALTTLMHERVSIGRAVGPRGSGPIATAVRLWAQQAVPDPVRRDRLVRLWVEAEVHRLTSLRAADNARAGTPGPEGSTAKLHSAELNQRIYELCVELLGPDGMGYDSYAMRRPDAAGGFGGGPARLFLRSRANSIEGGTSEVMRNILAERVLGLPR